MRAGAVACALCFATAFLVDVEPASAATVSVDSTRDSFGSPQGCSLREAVESVNQGADFGGCAGRGAYGFYDLIELPRGTFRLTLRSSEGETAADNSGGDLDLTGGDQVVIASPAQEGAVIDAGGVDRVLEVANYNSLLLLQGVTVTGGRAASEGGGILSRADVVLLMSAVLDNRAGGKGGGIALVDVASDATVINSTIAGNRAEGGGGGLALLGSDNTVADLSSATVVRNQAPTGGGILALGGSVDLENTILASNRGPARAGPDCAGAGLLSFGGNLVGTTSGCRLRLRPADILDPRPRVLAPARNGGPVPTAALGRRSPAIDSAKQGLCYELDARAAPRSRGGRCDIGAYERISCAGVLVDRVGSRRADRLVGTNGPDGILGLGGADRLIGRDGFDALCGGRGGDLLRGGSGRDRLLGGSGEDRCFGGELTSSCERTRGRPGRASG